MIRLDLLEKPTGTYDVWYAGDKIISGSSDPEFDACRYLQKLGLTGTIETFSPGCMVARMRIDIEKGATMTVQNNGGGTPMFRRARNV